MAARWPSGSDFGAYGAQCVGFRYLFCRHHSCELEIPFCHTHRFLNRDYIMFDCGGMAFSETDFHASVAIVRSEVSTALSTAAIACHKLYQTGPMLRLIPIMGIRGERHDQTNLCSDLLCMSGDARRICFAEPPLSEYSRRCSRTECHDSGVARAHKGRAPSRPRGGSDRG